MEEYHSSQLQHVFLITDGPNCIKTIHNGDWQNSCPNIQGLRQFFYDACLTHDTVVFRIMPGITCTSVRNTQGWLEIEPLLLTPIPMTVALEEVSDEAKNSLGLSLYARVQEVKGYKDVIPASYQCKLSIPLLKPGSMVQISYNLMENTGGFTEIKSAFAEDYQPPLINSRCELHREFVKGSLSRRGCSVYKASSTSAETPVSHTLRLFTITTLS